MKKSLCVILLAGLVLSLTGCQLAQEDSGSSDQLVGAFVTTEPLDLLDTDALLQEHAGEIAAGKEITLESKQAGQRLYATLVEGEDPYYTFEGVEGLPVYYLNLNQGTDQPERTISSPANGEGVLTVDAGTADPFCTLEATLYLPTQGGSKVFYFHPIYQTQTGAVYLTPSGMGMRSSPGSTGAMSQEIKEKTTVTADGKTTTETVTVTCTIQPVDLAERMVWVQMDGACRVLCETEVWTDRPPETVTLEEDAAFLLVEHYQAGQETPIRRELVEKGAETITSYQDRPGCFLGNQQTKLIWP